jgi:predicted secreted Zn-dependent protease
MGSIKEQGPKSGLFRRVVHPRHENAHWNAFTWPEATVLPSKGHAEAWKGFVSGRAHEQVNRGTSEKQKKLKEYSVDPETDTRMQELIRSDFQDYTVIVIAHRLSSLLDFDKVIVLDGGRLVESGKPSELLREGSSRFSRLYNSSVST